MSNKDVYDISRLISEDPDIINEEENWGIPITYTNHMGETKTYHILRAWPRFYRGTTYIGYSVEWPNGTFGFFKLDGLSDESYELLKRRFGTTRQDAWALSNIKRERRRDRKRKTPTPEKRHKWNYMFRTYGRCCPNWWEASHIATQGDCWQADQMGRQIASAAPDPHKAKLSEGDFLGGTITIKYSQETDQWILEEMGEEPRVFEDTDDLMDYLEETLPPDDLDEIKNDMLDIRADERMGARRDEAMKAYDQRKAAAREISTTTIESDYGPITITRGPDGSIELSMEDEEPIAFEDPRAASMFLSRELGIDFLIEHKRRRKVLLEGISPDDLTRILTEMGYDNIQFVVPNDNEFKRLDVFGGAFDPATGKHYQLGDPMTDMPEEKLKAAIKKIEASQPSELDPAAMEELEELQNDASLFVIAAKQVGNMFVGITIMSLDDPDMQFDMPDWQGEDDGDDDVLSVDELEKLFSAPAYDPRQG